jgi:hypothetical protein
MDYIYDDGGRADAGFEGYDSLLDRDSDCVCRSIAIAAELPYQKVYDRLAEESATRHRRDGYTHPPIRVDWCWERTKKWFKNYMSELGFVWTDTPPEDKKISGRHDRFPIHLRADELPSGRLVCELVYGRSRSVAVIDGVIYDTADPNAVVRFHRGVYGYWKLS